MAVPRNHLRNVETMWVNKKRKKERERKMELTWAQEDVDRSSRSCDSESSSLSPRAASIKPLIRPSIYQVEIDTVQANSVRQLNANEYGGLLMAVSVKLPQIWYLTNTFDFSTSLYWIIMKPDKKLFFFITYLFVIIILAIILTFSIGFFFCVKLFKL